MEQPQNPYTEQVSVYEQRAKTGDFINPEAFYAASEYYHGQRKGWNEGYEVGTKLYFNVNSQNDCVDTLHTYLSSLAQRVKNKFGETSPIALILSNMILSLEGF